MTVGGRVLVTGANGFVGRALISALVETGVGVTAAVRRDTALPEGLRISTIEGVGPDTRWDDALAGCDVVVHLAARVHVTRDRAADPLAEYRRVNVAGTLALARQAASGGVRRFVFVSSVKVNGESTRPGQAFRETDPPQPTDAYGVSKAEAENGLLELGQAGGMEIVVVRPPLVYGPGVKANFLSMLRLLARGVPLPLGAIHDNRRSLLGLDNLVGLLRTCLTHPAAANQVFLAGDGEDLSTTDLLRRAAVALGVRARLVPVPVPLLLAAGRLLGRRELTQRLCGNLQVDISKAQTRLGWKPQVSVDEGLRRAVGPLLVKETGS